MLQYREINSVIDRLLMISWLCKDFGWMATDIYLGFPFGFISVATHFLLIIFDPRKSYRYYNLSLFFWVSANFLWMTLEFTSSKPSSDVHFGPYVPVGGINPTNQQIIRNIKTVLFAISVMIQIGMYSCIYWNIIKMPENYNEDIVVKQELQMLISGKFTKKSLHTDASLFREDDVLSDESLDITASTRQYYVSVAFVENSYIIFWSSKDLFWSWSTGEIAYGRDYIITLESLSMFFGTISFCIYCITAYINRRNYILFIDCITILCWISANFIWMCGEFFLRYQNLTYDDINEGRDTSTRMIAAILFSMGIFIQIILISFFSIKYLINQRKSQRKKPIIQMLTLEKAAKVVSNRFTSKNKHRNDTFFSPFSPQKLRNQENDDDDDVEDTVMF